jgi:hypothetical protein
MYGGLSIGRCSQPCLSKTFPDQVDTRRKVVKFLPEDLTVDVFARLPFPYVCTVPVLSRLWSAILSASSLDTEKKKQCAIPYQEKLVERSINSNTFWLFHNLLKNAGNSPKFIRPKNLQLGNISSRISCVLFWSLLVAHMVEIVVRVCFALNRWKDHSCCGLPRLEER